jgi:hypothetical protein
MQIFKGEYQQTQIKKFLKYKLIIVILQLVKVRSKNNFQTYKDNKATLLYPYLILSPQPKI